MRDGERNSQMIGRLQSEAKQILDSVNQLIYFMRGSVTYTEAMNMSYAERTLVSTFIERRFEAEKKNPHLIIFSPILESRFLGIQNMEIIEEC